MCERLGRGIEQPQAGGRIVFGSTGDPKTMNPVIATDTQSRDIWDKVYSV